MQNPFKYFLDYAKDNPKGYWFKKKMYGWGWTPVKWQGWAVIAVYVLILIVLAQNLDKNTPSDQVFSSFLIPIILLTAILIFVCYKKGEKPSWQWGRKDGEDNKNTK